MEECIRGHEVRAGATVGPPLAKEVPSFQCSLVSKLSQGNGLPLPSHAPVDGASVGQHPLTSRFMLRLLGQLAPSATLGPPLAKAVPSFQCSLVSKLSQGNENLMLSLQ